MRSAVRVVAFASFLLALQHYTPVQSAQEGSPPNERRSSADTDRSSLLASEESLARFHQILQRRPLHNPAFKGLVKHYSEQGKLDELVREYEAKSKALPDDHALKIVMARLYLRSGQPEKASTMLDAVSELPKASSRTASKLLVLKSEVYERSGKPETAIKMLSKALGSAKTVSERLKLAESLADLHIRSKNKNKASEVLTDLVSDFPDQYLHRKRIADSLAQRSLHESAVEQYQGILALVREDAVKRCEVLRSLGLSLERLDRRQEAIDVYAEAINLLSGGHWMQRDLHDRIVSLYRASGRLDALVVYCRDQIERSPEQTAMRGLLADVLVAMDKADDAKQIMQEAVQLFPKDRTLSEQRIQLLDRLGDPAAVTAEFERIISQHPDDIEFYVRFGQFLADNEKLEGARNQWKHVLNSEVVDATLANRLGALFEPYDLFDDAVECYERSIKLSPERLEGYMALSRLALFQGDKKRAEATLQRMQDANPDNPAAFAASCQALLNLGQVDKALAAVTRACELDPETVRYQINRADLLVQTGQIDEALLVRRATLTKIRNPRQQSQAIDSLVSMHATANQLENLAAAEKKKLESEPSDPISLFLLARIADHDGRFPAARDWLGKLLEAHPSHEDARRHLAKLYEAVGDIDSAVDTYKALIDLHPTRGRQYYQAMADLRLRYHDKAGAVETFETMVRAAPKNATVLKSVAEQLVRLDEFKRAIGYYEQALAIQPDRHEVQLEYAKALQESGRLEDSLTAYKSAALHRDDRDTASEALAKLHDVAGQLGSLDELLYELQARVEGNPEDTLVARSLGNLLIREFEYHRALGLLDLVVRHNPRDAGLLLVRAELLRRLTRFDESLDTYRKVLRFPNIDRDYVLGEMGKANFEAGRYEQCKRIWRQINHKLYAGTLLENNGFVDEAIEVFKEGIRLKPGDFGLHRNLIAALQSAGKTDESLEAARRLLDLEPDNIVNIREVAKAYLDRGDREGAADVAGRLFSSGVVEKKRKGASATNRSGMMRGMPIWAISMQTAWGQGMGPSRSNLDRAVQFFMQNGLLAELEEVLERQLLAQPDNAVLRQTAVTLFSETFGKPQRALDLLAELETAQFPLEHQNWLGRCSQRDFMRVAQYQLIGRKPGLRDSRLKELEGREKAEQTRDERLELAVIRQGQGATDESIGLLESAVNSKSDDLVALSVLVGMLLQSERFDDARPHTQELIQLLEKQHNQMEKELIERVRRDFVRTLPLQFQLRVSEDLLRDIARKWTLGQGMVADFTGFVQTMGYFRARLTLATIEAKTGNMASARAIWEDLTPANPADADGWTMLAGVAQLHEQNDLAFKYYEKALQAAKLLATDPLLQRVFSSSLSSVWFGRASTIDSSFNKIVEAFANENKLIDLYDFLRETNQEMKARRVAEQYELYDDLKSLYSSRLEKARETFLQSGEEPLRRSVPYFAEVCKLADVLDQTGAWPEAQAVYERYLEEFPDELGLLVTLGEVAEAQEEYAPAVQWEKRVLEAKTRLSRTAREWMLRSVTVTPSIPRILKGSQNQWAWMQRWGSGYGWGWGGGQGSPLDRSASWMRIAQLHLALENIPASADAMNRAVGLATQNRANVGGQILSLIRQRQLIAEMLPVLRSLAVHIPTHENIQLAFGESLEENGKKEVASEVYQRMLRRGVSDISVLARLRAKLAEVNPVAADSGIETLASLQAAVESDPENANKLLRLAKANYYLLNVESALERLLTLAKTAPHLDGLHDLLIEIYTIQDKPEALIEALQAKIDRSKDDRQKKSARHRLVEELLTLGRTEEAIDSLKHLVDPKDPSSYQHVGMLLHYFGRHEEAVDQFKLAGRSQRRGSGGGGRDASNTALAKAMILQGELSSAADKILEAVDNQTRQATQFSGMAGMYGFDQSSQNYFQPFVSLFVMRPALYEQILERLATNYDENPNDPQAAKRLMQLHRCMGRADLAESILEKMTTQGATDQALVTRLIDRAIKQQEYEKAIKLAKKWISQQPKPKLPPGMPPQFAGMMSLMSPRNSMICKLGDVYWKLGDKEQAFETYRQVLDEEVEATRIAFAAICVLRGREDEARSLVEEALSDQQVKSPSLLQFSAFLAALDDKPERAFELLAEATKIGEGQAGNPFAMYSEGNAGLMLPMFARECGLLDLWVEFQQKRIENDPNNWQNHLMLAQAYHEEGHVEQALEVLDKAAAVKSLRREALGQRIQWLEGTADRETLISLYRKLIKISERKVKPRSSLMTRFLGSRSQDQIDTQPQRDRLGTLLWENGNREEAEKVWGERMDLKSAQSLALLGRRFLDRKDHTKAYEYFSRALEIDPGDIGIRQTMADLEFHREDYGQALQHLCEVFQRRDRQNNRWARRSWRYGQNAHVVDNLRLRALELSKTPEVISLLEREQGMGDERLALASMTGDWQGSESEIRKKLETAPYDPKIWTLWATAQERNGNWQEAVKAWEYLRRLKRTTISDHRDKLKLVLAGKHIKDAAAGSRRAQPGAAAAARSMMGQRTSYPRYYSGGVGQEASRLANLYVKLGQFDNAEKLYLFTSERGSPQHMLSSIAQLMWRQDAKDRALELIEFALILSDDTSLIPRYASMLAETGEVETAVGLLTRAYRTAASQESDGGFSYYRGWYGGGRDNREFENDLESSYASTLFDILKRDGSLEAKLKAFESAVGEAPDDSRLAKLTLSLQISDRRWRDARASLEAWRQARPDDMAILTELLHVVLQLEDWAAAEEVLKTVQREAPEMMDKWRMYEAFIALMLDRPDEAIAAVDSLLQAENPSGELVQLHELGLLLASARQHGRLVEFLVEAQDRRLLDDRGRVLLGRLHRMQGDWNAAAALSVEQLWRQPVVLDQQQEWYRELVFAIRAAQAAGKQVELSTGRPEDYALQTLAAEGSPSGRKAFLKLTQEQPDNLNAWRGLILAARLDGDPEAALESNAAVLKIAGKKRSQVWRPVDRQPLGTKVSSFLKNLQTTTTDTSSAMQMSMSFSSLIQQALGLNDYREQKADKYESLWKAHALLQNELLLCTGNVEAFTSSLRHQAAHAAATQQRMSGGRYSQYGYPGGYYPPRSRHREQGEFASDWRSALRDGLRQHGQFETLAQHLEELGGRLKPQQWSVAAESNAALGRIDVARGLGERLAEARLTEMRATDQPKVGGSEYGYWRWNRYGNLASQEEDRIRTALKVSPAQPTDSEKTSRLEGELNDLWEFALVDPGVAARLLEQEKVIRPGWGDSNTLQALIKYHRAKEQHKRIVELIEAAVEFDGLLESQRLSDYLLACFETADFTRVDSVLTAVAERGSMLENDVMLMRMILLRHQDEHERADELEQAVIAGCQVELPNRHRIDARLVGELHGESWQQRPSRFRSARYRGSYRQAWSGASPNLSTINALANALGLRFQQKVQPRDLTLTRVMDAYARHGLFSHAARIADIALSRHSETITPRERIRLVRRQAEWLTRGGDSDSGRRLFDEVEAFWKAEGERHPASAIPFRRLFSLYASKTFGPDLPNALDALRRAKQLDPQFDRFHTVEGRILYKMGRHQDSWRSYQLALLDGRLANFPAGDMYRAGLAAHHSGETDQALRLIRQASWRDPTHDLELEARELIDGK